MGFRHWLNNPYSLTSWAGTDFDIVDRRAGSTIPPTIPLHAERYMCHDFHVKEYDIALPSADVRAMPASDISVAPRIILGVVNINFQNSIVHHFLHVLHQTLKFHRLDSTPYRKWDQSMRLRTSL